MVKKETHKVSKMPIEVKNLKEFFAEYLEDVPKDKYGLSWAGKINAKKEALIPTTKTLNPQEEESKNWDETENIFIEGDNLEALKLLQRKYFEKIKMIYIDPPYNTGKDFIYRDNFSRTKKEEMEDSGEMENGAVLSTNTKTNGRFHSDWLNMMYSRLFLAHKLLKDDGVIFVSIDDNEVANLRLLMDEIFGEENFVANIIWHSKYTTSNDAKYVSYQHENIIFFAKNKELFKIGGFDRTAKHNKSYTNPDKDPKGKWKSTPIHAKSGSEKNNYTIVFPNGHKWEPPKGRYPRYNQKRLLEIYNEGGLYFNKNGGVDRKTYLSEVKQIITPGSIWNYDEVGHTHGNNEELADLLGKGIFDNPKGSKLISRMCKIANARGKDVVLDFFAGSGTVAHAVMDLNAEDGGDRKYICVQLDEEVDKKSEASKAGYKNIAEISRERIRRAGDKIGKGDVGFRSFEVANSNYREWEAGDFDMFEEKLLEQAKLFTDKPLIDNYKEVNVVFELVVKEGFALSAKIAQENGMWKIEDEDRRMFIDFGKKVEVKKVEKLELDENDIFVCFDSALTDNSKVNLIKGNVRVLVI